MQLRRMSKPIRLSVAAVKHILPEETKMAISAINVGTAYGMLTDSENFLSKLVLQDEEMLNPTAFIQSTQNTVGGQVALMLGCEAPNMTYVQRGHSFEHALLDIELSDCAIDNYILGGVDEITPLFHDIVDNLVRLYAQSNNTNYLSEGAAYLRVSNTQKADSIAAIADTTYFTTRSLSTFRRNVLAFLALHNIQQLDDIHLVIGNAPNNSLDIFFKILTRKLLPNANVDNYKLFASDFPTASAVGVCYGVKKMQEQNLERVLIVQNYQDDWSLWLLDAIK